MNNGTLHITSGISCISVQGYLGCLEISIDVDDLCAYNNYNGDHAHIDLSIAQVKELHDYLTCVLNANQPTQPNQPKE